jgi:hypothetical protein
VGNELNDTAGLTFRTNDTASAMLSDNTTYFNVAQWNDCCTIAISAASPLTRTPQKATQLAPSSLSPSFAYSFSMQHPYLVYRSSLLATFKPLGEKFYPNTYSCSSNVHRSPFGFSTGCKGMPACYPCVSHAVFDVNPYRSPLSFSPDPRYSAL